MSQSLVFGLITFTLWGYRLYGGRSKHIVPFQLTIESEKARSGSKSLLLVLDGNVYGSTRER